MSRTSCRSGSNACPRRRSRRDCPAGLATGTGTGFRFITDHVADFSKRGICARDPTRALIDQAAMKMPRRSKVSADFEPYSPAGALPYGHRWRLIHNPNDAFLTANTHREGISMFDILQPAYAALTSGRVPSDRRGPRDRRRPRDAPRARAARQGEEAGGRGAAELAGVTRAPSATPARCASARRRTRPDRRPCRSGIHTDCAARRRASPSSRCPACCIRPERPGRPWR